MKVYVLFFEMYGEWSWENGACDLIGVYSTKEKALEELKILINAEINDFNHIVEEPDINVDMLLTSIKNNNYIKCSVYANKDNYYRGFDDGVFVIEEREVTK